MGFIPRPLGRYKDLSHFRYSVVAIDRYFSRKSGRWDCSLAFGMSEFTG